MASSSRMVRRYMRRKSRCGEPRFFSGQRPFQAFMSYTFYRGLSARRSLGIRWLWLRCPAAVAGPSRRARLELPTAYCLLRGDHLRSTKQTVMPAGGTPPMKMIACRHDIPCGLLFSEEANAGAVSVSRERQPQPLGGEQKLRSSSRAPDMIGQPRRHRRGPRSPESTMSRRPTEPEPQGTVGAHEIVNRILEVDVVLQVVLPLGMRQRLAHQPPVALA